MWYELQFSQVNILDQSSLSKIYFYKKARCNAFTPLHWNEYSRLQTSYLHCTWSVGTIVSPDRVTKCP